MTDNEFAKTLDWPRYRVYRHEINQQAKKLRLWIRRERGRKFTDFRDVTEREVRELHWGEFQTSVSVELRRVRCPDCGVKREKAP